MVHFTFHYQELFTSKKPNVFQYDSIYKHPFFSEFLCNLYAAGKFPHVIQIKRLPQGFPALITLSM